MNCCTAPGAPAPYAGAPEEGGFLQAMSSIKMDAHTGQDAEMAQFPPPQQSSQSKVGKSPRPPSQLQSSMRQVQGREVPTQVKISFFCTFFAYLMSIPLVFVLFYHNFPVL